VLESLYENLIRTMQLTRDLSQVKLIHALEEYYQGILRERDKNFIQRMKIFFKLDRSCLVMKKGMYIWGDVGRGKSMIMDLFFNHLKGIQKRRYHFHHFMQEFHKSIVKWNATNSSSQDDAITDIGKSISKNTQVICLDELQVNNIADAMILQRLFNILFKNNVFLFITSNFMPEDLYEDGLQRANFLPCVQLINSRLDVFNLNNHVDYRLEKINSIERLYYWPLDDELKYYMQSVLSTLIGEHDFSSEVLRVDKNKNLTVLRSYGQLAMFSFAELCETPLGASDYMAICKRLSTVIITEIMQMGVDDHNEALRFITLIDCLYENKNKLICTAEVSIDNLYTGNKHSIEFKRAISRLHEMQSIDYLDNN